jgi:hypothetical protein
MSDDLYQMMLRAGQELIVQQGPIVSDFSANNPEPVPATPPGIPQPKVSRRSWAEPGYAGMLKVTPTIDLSLIASTLPPLSDDDREELLLTIKQSYRARTREKSFYQ